MKKIKFLVMATVLFSAIAGISFYLVRSASYTIQTSGKLYIVNKLSRSITVFDLFKGEELTEFTLEIEHINGFYISTDDEDIVNLISYGQVYSVKKSHALMNQLNFKLN